MTVITHIDDLKQLAKKRVPKMFYDYADSGSYTQSTYRANEDDFQKIKLRQRVAINMEGRSTASTMIGQNVSMPVAIAPTGMTGMQHADGEILAARAAKKIWHPIHLIDHEHLLDRRCGATCRARLLVSVVCDARPFFHRTFD